MLRFPQAIPYIIGKMNIGPAPTSGGALNGNLFFKKQKTLCQPTLKLAGRQSPELGI